MLQSNHVNSYPRAIPEIVGTFQAVDLLVTSDWRGRQAMDVSLTRTSADTDTPAIKKLRTTPQVVTLCMVLEGPAAMHLLATYDMGLLDLVWQRCGRDCLVTEQSLYYMFPLDAPPRAL